jgi:uncharacterized protein (DUF488 family)
VLIYTVGHSTRSQAELLEVIADIAVLVDVRSFPGSRRHPQFNREALARWLRAAGIEYLHLPELGGRRRPQPDSPNGAWRERGFRAYADHLASPEFARGIERLEVLARQKPTAVMCAEALWWRCHRRLIADWLVAHGWEVRHLGSGAPTKHELPEFARREADGRLTYPPRQTALRL